ncbi:hypothetical protein G6F24_014269 [Rhizopus arrhizus]|nr:hypothetical protein G6F24_014269 [Rhizopus arrhizus]
METLKYYGMNKGTIYLQQDNDPKHKSKSTMSWLKQNKVQYINDWPPNSPDLNPIEHVWHLLKLRLSLHERTARNIDELWERVDSEWNKLDKDVCKSYIDSMPDPIAAVVPIFSPSVRITWVVPMMVESNSSIEEWMDGAAILGSREPEETAEVVIPEDCASEDKVETSDIRRTLSG